MIYRKWQAICLKSNRNVTLKTGSTGDRTHTHSHSLLLFHSMIHNTRFRFRERFSTGLHIGIILKLYRRGKSFMASQTKRQILSIKRQQIDMDIGYTGKWTNEWAHRTAPHRTLIHFSYTRAIYWHKGSSIFIFISFCFLLLFFFYTTIKHEHGILPDHAIVQKNVLLQVSCIQLILPLCYVLNHAI